MKVLVVDDQKLNRSLLQHMLLQDGYEVLLAEDGYQAIEQVKSGSPDLVLLDVIMPNLDGFETAPRLKAMSGEVYLPIIFITALGDQESLKRCLDVGGDDFLNKPFDRVILQAKIQAHGRIRDLSIKTYEQKLELDYHRLQTEREHKIVEHIFNRALEGNYKAPHLLEFSLSPAAMFNGDIMLVALGPTGNLYIMMGDFTGHGLSSAIGTLPASRTFYSMAQKGMSVGDIALEINRILLTLLPPDMFCAASIIELNATGKSLSIWSGGTPDMYLLQQGVGITHTVTSQHMALGILETDEFERTYENFSVTPDHKLVVFTDGVVEAFNSAGDMFGYDRVIELVDKPELVNLQQIIEPLDTFRGDAERDDDISLLLLTCNSVDSAQEEQDVSYSTLPHSFQLKIDAQQMKHTDPIVEVIDMLTMLPGADEHRSTLFLLLSEAYNNALDHGILNLDSQIKETDEGFIEYYVLREQRLAALEHGHIEIKVNYEPMTTAIRFIIRDTGQGFRQDTCPYQNVEQALEHGRGNLLLHELASSIEYNDAGNQITFSYLLNQNSPK